MLGDGDKDVGRIGGEQILGVGPVLRGLLLCDGSEIENEGDAR